jgi:hypothetical protein
LYHIHEQTSVTDYVVRFAKLIDQLAAYEQNMNSLHYITRFQDGLWPHICAAVAIQCPVELNTAYSLALLQEEMSEQPVHGHGRLLPLTGPAPILALPAPPRRPMPLPEPPPPVNKMQVHLEKQHVAESSRVTQVSLSVDAKWIVLRNYRRARGQWYTCGERYSREYQCKGTVQLHVLQEVLDVFQGEEASDDDQSSSNSATVELHLMTTETVIKDPSTLTFQLTGVV